MQFILQLNLIRERTNGPTMASMKAEIETIDPQWKRIVLKGKKKSRKLKMGNIPYATDDFQCYGQQMRLWSLVIKKKKRRHISSKLIKCKAKKCKLENYMSYSIQEATDMKRTMWKKDRAKNGCL